MTELLHCLPGHWMHSHEEDTPDARVYRRANFDFPPARGRVGFDFRAGGELVYYGIARGDGSELDSGRWVVEDTDRVRIELDSERIRPFVLEILSCDQDQLRVRR